MLSSDSRNLDILRALAVSLVLADHIVQAVFGARFAHVAASLGTIGVLFFFVHTGTVLMLSLERDSDARRFYVRRFFRIYPLSIAAVLFVLGLRIPVEKWPLMNYVHFPAKDILANLTLTQNLFGSRDAIGVLWSLPLEVQMYFVLPFLFRWKLKMEWLWVASVVLALVWLPYRDIPHSGLWRLTVIPFVPCFIPGVIAYRHSLKAVRVISARLWLPVLLCLVGLFVAFRGNQYAGWAVCLIVGLAIPRFKEACSAKIAHVIAKYSYGIYLSHLICLWLAFNYLHSDSTTLRVLVFLVTGAAVPFALYHAIEHPFIEFAKRLTRHDLKAAHASVGT